MASLPLASGDGVASVRGLRLLAVPADAEQALLEIAVAGEFARIHDPVDPAIDHDGDGVGDGRGDADVLLDDEDREVLLARKAKQQIAHLRRRSPARAPRWVRPSRADAGC